MRNFEATLQSSEAKAENLHEAQKLQYEAIVAHSQAQNNLQTNMRVSHALVDRVTAAAANLQTMIDDSATRYRQSPVFNGPLGPYSTWTMCVLLFSMLGIQNPRSALVLLLIGMGEYTLTYSPIQLIAKAY